MSTLSDLRRRAGLWRYRVLHGRRNRRMADEAARVRETVAPLLGRLPPVAARRGEAIEVHMMCGEGQAVMGCLASWSLLRFDPRLRLVLHSDGTLTGPTLEAWAGAVPDLRLIEREEGLENARAALSGHPLTLDWTERYHFGLKLGGFYGTAGTGRIMELDSDVLTLDRPGDLLSELDRPAPSMAWNRDHIYAYAYAPRILREALGDLVPEGLPDRLNAGYLASFAFGAAEWDRIEAALDRLGRDGRTDPLRYWTHQTLLAVVAAGLGQGRARPLPAAYDMHDGPTRSRAVMRHYPGAPGLRPRFFTEGVRAVIRTGLSDGTLSDAFRDPVLTGDQ